jgi:endonuclease YncB( thermonuclease family)
MFKRVKSRESRTNMSMKKATPVEIMDGKSFRLRTDAIIILDGVEAPDKSTPAGQKARNKLAELVLNKKVEYETTQWTSMGQTKAVVTLEGVNINEKMNEFLASL